jgi:hypothetical protein
MRKITSINYYIVLVEKMTLDQANCFYHPNRAAVTKCEHCNRMICLEDKMTYRVTGGIDQADDIYTYCPICYNERMRTTKKMRPFIFLIFGVFVIIFIAVAIFIFLSIMQMMSNFPSP